MRGRTRRSSTCSLYHHFNLNIRPRENSPKGPQERDGPKVENGGNGKVTGDRRSRGQQRTSDKAGPQSKGAGGMMEKADYPGGAARDVSSNKDKQTTSRDREAKKDAVEEVKGNKSREAMKDAGDAARDWSSNKDKQTTSMDREAKKDAVEEGKGNKSSSDNGNGKAEICNELGGKQDIVGNEEKEAGEDCEGKQGRREGMEVSPSYGERNEEKEAGEDCEEEQGRRESMEMSPSDGESAGEVEVETRVEDTVGAGPSGHSGECGGGGAQTENRGGGSVTEWGPTEECFVGNKKTCLVNQLPPIVTSTKTTIRGAKDEKDAAEIEAAMEGMISDESFGLEETAGKVTEVAGREKVDVPDKSIQQASKGGKIVKKKKSGSVSSPFSAVVFNEEITFIATSAKATKHNKCEDGTLPCGLSPYCKNILKGSKLVGRILVISPDNHPFYTKECAACWEHAEASVNGEEKQDSSSLVLKTRYARTRKSRGKPAQ